MAAAILFGFWMPPARLFGAAALLARLLLPLVVVVPAEAGLGPVSGGSEPMKLLMMLKLLLMTLPLAWMF